MNEVKIQGNKILKEEKRSEDIDMFFKKTFKNTISACILSLIATIVTFICNIPLLRKISKETYGVVKVHFELAFVLVNYIPREAMRRASQKFCPDKDPEKEKEKFITISKINYLFMIFNSIISIIIFFCFILFTDSKKLHENYIHLFVYVLTSFLELIIEPVAMYMNLHMENKFLPIITSSISRVVSNTLFAVLFNKSIFLGFGLSFICNLDLPLGVDARLGFGFFL